MSEPTRTHPPDPNNITRTSAPDAGVSAIAGETVDLPGYEHLTEIGRGGMGIVYRAHDIDLAREVAVKVLLPQFTPDSATARRFMDEARITGRLQHPGIPAIYRVGTLADGRPFLAMKLIAGRTLDDLLKEPADSDSERLAVPNAFRAIRAGIVRPTRRGPSARAFSGGLRAGRAGHRLRAQGRRDPPRPETVERHGRRVR